MSAAKFICVKTSSGKVVATSFLYLTVHRCILGDVLIYVKFAFSDPPPLKNADFDRFRLIVPQRWELARKVQLSVITDRKSTTRFPSSHRWTLCVTPKSPKWWLKTRSFTFGVALHFFVAGNRRHFKLNMWVEHSKSQPMDDKLSLKWAWSLSRDLFNFWKISDNISKTVRDSLIVSTKFE